LSLRLLVPNFFWFSWHCLKYCEPSLNNSEKCTLCRSMLLRSYVEEIKVWKIEKSHFCLVFYFLIYIFRNLHNYH
jgi:hypothetical protein